MYVNRGLGVVMNGGGGSASSYTFDPKTGLSSDPRLAYFLQNLTPAQLQGALDGQDPTSTVRQQLIDEQQGTGDFWLTCGQPGNPCGPPADSSAFSNPFSSLTIPSWVWFAGAAVTGVFLLGAVKR